MSNSIIPHVNSHKDLGLILSEDLSWDKHYKDITAHSYKILGLIRRTFAPPPFTFYIHWLDCMYHW